MKKISITINKIISLSLIISLMGSNSLVFAQSVVNVPVKEYTTTLEASNIKEVQTQVKDFYYYFDNRAESWKNLLYNDKALKELTTNEYREILNVLQESIGKYEKLVESTERAIYVSDIGIHSSILKLMTDKYVPESDRVFSRYALEKDLLGWKLARRFGDTEPDIIQNMKKTLNELVKDLDAKGIRNIEINRHEITAIYDYIAQRTKGMRGTLDRLLYDVEDQLYGANAFSVSDVLTYAWKRLEKTATPEARKSMELVLKSRQELKPSELLNLAKQIKKVVKKNAAKASIKNFSVLKMFIRLSKMSPRARAAYIKDFVGNLTQEQREFLLVLGRQDDDIVIEIERSLREAAEQAGKKAGKGLFGKFLMNGPLIVIGSFLVFQMITEISADSNFGNATDYAEYSENIKKQMKDGTLTLGDAIAFFENEETESEILNDPEMTLSYITVILSLNEALTSNIGKDIEKDKEIVQSLTYHGDTEISFMEDELLENMENINFSIKEKHA